MTLADAIRKGAAQHPQCAGVCFQRHPLDGITASCVLGAALVGIFGAATGIEDLGAFTRRYPELMAQEFPTCPTGAVCPDFLVEALSLYATLAHLNDRHQWTREQCADWLEARG